jgi:hypothetical protein
MLLLQHALLVGVFLTGIPHPAAVSEWPPQYTKSLECDVHDEQVLKKRALEQIYRALYCSEVRYREV